MIEKISVGNVVEFSRRSEKWRATYINSLKKQKKEPSAGGNYWVICSSAVGNYFREGNNNLILEKIEEVIEKRDKAKAKISKDMYQQNISILNSFDGFDFSSFKPNSQLQFLSKPKEKSIVTIRGVPLQILPSYVFSFRENDIDKIGAIWLVIKKDGFDIKETSLFADALYRYLKGNYRKKEVDPHYCIAFDLMKGQHVRYAQIENKKLISDLDSILGKIKKLL